MCLHLLNVSVDAVDPNPEFISEDLSINDQESIVEIIVEKVLGFEDAFVEYDDRDSEDQNKKKSVDSDWLTQTNFSQKTSNWICLKSIDRFPHFEANLAIGFMEIDSPPPKS